MLQGIVNDLSLMFKNTFSRTRQAIANDDAVMLHNICVKQPQILSSEIDIDGNVPLGYAIKCRSVDSIRCLIQCGADIDEANIATGLPPLFILATAEPDEDNKITEVVQILLDNGADINKDRIRSCYDGEGTAYMEYITPLSEAILAENESMVSCYIDKGADVNFKCRESKHTPLLWSLATGHANIIGLLIKHGASVVDASSDKSNAFHWLSVSGKPNPVITDMLLSKGCDINTKNAQGITPLMMAIKRGSCEFVSTLLEKGADTTLKDADGLTALDYSAAMKCQQCYSDLLKKG